MNVAAKNLNHVPFNHFFVDIEIVTNSVMLI